MSAEIEALIPAEYVLTEAERELLEEEKFGRIAYDGLVAYATETIHGARFEMRPYDPNYPLFRLSNALVAATVDHNATDTSALLARGLVTNIDDFTGAVKDVYTSSRVQNHLKNGGSLLWFDNHITYEGEPALNFSLTQARLELGDNLEDIVTGQYIVAGRLIGTFAFGGLGVADTLLLPNGNILQTLPLTKSGAVLPKGVRQAANKLFKYEQAKVLLTPRTNTAVNFSGRQDALLDGSYVMHPIHNRTMELYNSLDGSQADVLAIPFFVRSEGIDSMMHKQGTETADFAFGEPRELKSYDDIKNAYHEIAEIGTKALESSYREDRRGRRVVFDQKGTLTKAA